MIQLGVILTIGNMIYQQKKNYNYIDFIQPKKEVKDIQKVSFTFDKLYTEESLNEEELLAYYKYEAKNKAYYEYQ